MPNAIKEIFYTYLPKYEIFDKSAVVLFILFSPGYKRELSMVFVIPRGVNDIHVITWSYVRNIGLRIIQKLN